MKDNKPLIVEVELNEATPLQAIEYLRNTYRNSVTLVHFTDVTDRYLPKQRVEEVLEAAKHRISYQATNIAEALDIFNEETKALLSDSEPQKQREECDDITWHCAKCRRSLTGQYDICTECLSAVSNWPTRWYSVAEHGLPENRENGWWGIGDNKTWAWFYKVNPDAWMGVTHYCSAPPLPDTECSQTTTKCCSTTNCASETTGDEAAEVKQEEPLRCPWCDDEVNTSHELVTTRGVDAPITERWWSCYKCGARGPNCDTEQQAIDSLKGEL